MTAQALQQSPAISTALATAWQQFEDAREKFRAKHSQEASAAVATLLQDLAERGVRCSQVRRIEERIEGERVARLLHLSVTVHLGARLELDTRALESRPEAEHWSALAKHLRDATARLFCNQ